MTNAVFEADVIPNLHNFTNVDKYNNPLGISCVEIHQRCKSSRNFRFYLTPANKMHLNSFNAIFNFSGEMQERFVQLVRHQPE